MLWPLLFIYVYIMSSNLKLTRDICKLPFYSHGLYRENRKKCVRQNELLRVICPLSNLPCWSRHNSGNSRRPNPLVQKALIIPIDQPLYDVPDRSQSSLPIYNHHGGFLSMMLMMKTNNIHFKEDSWED